MAKTQARQDQADKETVPVLIEYQVPNHYLLDQISLPGTKSGVLLLNSGTEWYVKAILNNDRKSRKKRNNFVIIQLEIYAREEEENEDENDE